MSREFKFRAWDIDNKEYEYDIAIRPNNGIIGVEIFNNEMYPVEFRGIVEQYTGLKDRNSKEIYEGDIVKYGDSVAVIIWREENAEFGVRWLDCGVEDSISWQIGVEETPSEVIGNIHENPELIGGEE